MRFTQARIWHAWIVGFRQDRLLKSQWRLYILRRREYSTLISDMNWVAGVQPQRQPILVHNAAILFGFLHEFRSYATPVRYGMSDVRDFGSRQGMPSLAAAPTLHHPGGIAMSTRATPRLRHHRLTTVRRMKPNMEALELRDDRWVLQTGEGSLELRRWSNGRDTLEARYFPISPNIPTPLSRPDLMWKLRRLEGLFQQVAPVEIKTGVLDGNEYVSEIVKVSMNGRLASRGSLIIPKASFSLMFSVMAECDAADSERELHVAEVTLRDVSNVDERELVWFRDPFSFPVVSPVGRTCADDEMWDARYPEHPLSRIRRIFRDLVARCTVSADVSQATPFGGPRVPRLCLMMYSS